MILYNWLLLQNFNSVVIFVKSLNVPILIICAHKGDPCRVTRVAGWASMRQNVFTIVVYTPPQS